MLVFVSKVKKQDFQKVIDHTSEDLASIRTNRATPALVENIKVEVYGSPMPLVQVASITVPEPKQLLIEPWDKNIMKDAEKAIETASLGLSVKNEGNCLRLSIPPITEESRKQIVKVLHEKIENGKIAFRRA